MPSQLYTKLEEGQTRVLRLEPGEFGQPLVGSLEVISLLSNTDAEPTEDDESGSEFGDYTTSAYLEQPEDDIGEGSLPPSPTFKDYDSGDQLYHTGELDSDFEAISYSWAERILSHHLSIPPHGSLKITENLYSALQRFRDRKEIRRLWVDAISINQNDTAERSSQVAMMGTIFGSASRVRVWLGESEPADTLAFATIRTLFDDGYDPDADITSTLEHIENRLRLSPYCACCGAKAELMAQSAIAGVFAAAQLTRRQWFSRLWVVQEAALGRVVIMHSGPHSTSWRALRDLLELPGVIFDDPSIQVSPALVTMMPPSMIDTTVESVQLIQSYRSRRHQHFNASLVLRSLMALSSRKCYDPRDRIFAVRSIMGISKVTDLEPNYDLPVVELYKRVAIECLTHETRNVKTVPSVALLLALVGTESPNGVKGLPSWVPDFANLTMRSRAKDWAYSAFKWQFEEHPTGIECKVSPSQASLFVKGKVLGSVAEVLQNSRCPRLYPEEDYAGRDMPWTTLLSLIEWYQQCRSFSECHLQERFRSDQYLRDLLDCGDHWEHSTPPNYHKSLSVLSQFGEENTAELLQGQDPNEIFSCIDSFIGPESHSRYDRNRNLCSLNGQLRGRLAWVPQTAQQGDILCIFKGTPFPFVIRKWPGDDGFRLLGDAWVYPLNEEEAMGGKETQLGGIELK